MNVLEVLVSPATRIGGPPPFVGESAVELTRLGATVRTLATNQALAPWGWLQRQRPLEPDEVHPSFEGTDLRLYPARTPQRLAYSPGLRRALREQVGGFDLVHIHNLWQYPQLAAYREARRAGVPYIVSPHGGLDPFLRRRGRLRKGLTDAAWQRRMLAGSALLHVTTAAERDLTADVVPAVPRAIVPCGIYAGDFAELPGREDFRRRWLDGFDGPLVLFLGRLTEKKGLDVLLRSFAVAGVPGARLAVVGPDDSGLTTRLRALAAELGITADVTFTGPLYGEERLAALSGADLWALSSHAENFGIAVVEAMAAGCPVLISPAVNISAEISSADAGIVAEAEPRAFGAALHGLLGDSAERARLSTVGPGFASRYDWSVVGPQLLEMYRSAAATGGS